MNTSIFLKPIFARDGNRVRPSRWRLSRWFLPEDLETSQHGLLSLLDVIHRESLDPATYIDAFAIEQRGTYCRCVQSLARRLREGVILMDAIEQTPNVLSDDMVVALRLADQSGTLNPMHALYRRSRYAEAMEQRFDWAGFRFYWIVVGSVVMILLLLLSTITNPVIRLLSEVEGYAPYLLQRMSENLQYLGPIAWLFLFSVLLSIAFGWSFRLRQWIRNLASGWRVSKDQNALSKLLRILSVPVASGRPVTAALSTLAKYHYQAKTRSALLLARNEIEHGAEPWSSLALAGLLTPEESHAIHVSGDPVSQGWVLRRIADEHERQYRHQCNLWSSIANPIMVLLVGAIVLWVAYAILGSLYGLVVHLS